LFKPKADKIIRSERVLLRERFLNQAKGAKIGSKEALKAKKQFQTSLREYASDLPLLVKNRIFSKVNFQDIKSLKDLKNVMGKVDTARLTLASKDERLTLLGDVKRLLASHKVKGLESKMKTILREKVGVGEFTTKGESTFRQSLDSLSKEKLQKAKDILKKEFEKTPPEVKYGEFKKEDLVGTSKSNLGQLWEGITVGAEKSLTSLSTNIKKYGGSELMYAVRDKYKNLARKGYAQGKEVVSFFKGVKGMKKNLPDYQNFTKALYNQDFTKARELATKYKFSDGFEQVVKVLENIRA
jgi:hypothetical protein